MLPKKKSDVQLTGIDHFDMEKWAVPYESKVTTEFKQRYGHLVKLYEELMEEINWNNIIYGIDIRYEPVVGKSYYLYNEKDEYFLSMIAPWEWNKKDSFLGEFKLDHTGKWIKQEENGK